MKSPGEDVKKELHRTQEQRRLYLYLEREGSREELVLQLKKTKNSPEFSNSP